MKPIKPRSRWGSLWANTKLIDFSECYLCRSKPELQGSGFFLLIGWVWGVFWLFLCGCVVFFVRLSFFGRASVKCYIGFQICRKLWNYPVTSWPLGGKNRKGKEKKEKVKNKDKGKRKGKKVRGNSRISVWILRYLILLSTQSYQGQLRLPLPSPRRRLKCTQQLPQKL